MIEKQVIVLEVSNTTEEQIQIGLGQAFTDFCMRYNGVGIKANVLTELAGNKIITIINEGDNK